MAEPVEETPERDEEEEHYPFYRSTETETLRQGEILPSFPIVSVGGALADLLEGQGIDVRIDEFDVVIVSQSCDLGKDSAGNVLLVPIFDLDSFVRDTLNKSSEGAQKGAKSELKKGRRLGQYVLPPCEIDGFERGPCVANFQQVAVMPVQLVREYAIRLGTRVRLQSPYREDLSHSFGKFVARVGHPRSFEVT